MIPVVDVTNMMPQRLEWEIRVFDPPSRLDLCMMSTTDPIAAGYDRRHGGKLWNTASSRAYLGDRLLTGLMDGSWSSNWPQYALLEAKLATDDVGRY